MEVILFTFCILFPDVLIFWSDPMIHIAIFYLAIQYQMLNRGGAVKRLIVVYQSMLILDKYMV